MTILTPDLEAKVADIVIDSTAIEASSWASEAPELRSDRAYRSVKFVDAQLDRQDGICQVKSLFGTAGPDDYYAVLWRVDFDPPSSFCELTPIRNGEVVFRTSLSDSYRIRVQTGQYLGKIIGN